VELEGETVYTVTISGSARDLAGNQMGGPESFSFTTAVKEGTSGGTLDIMAVLLIIMIFIIILIAIVLLLKGKKRSKIDM
jgi:hypothetical protein